MPHDGAALVLRMADSAHVLCKSRARRRTPCAGASEKWRRKKTGPAQARVSNTDRGSNARTCTHLLRRFIMSAFARKPCRKICGVEDKIRHS